MHVHYNRPQLSKSKTLKINTEWGKIENVVNICSQSVNLINGLMYFRAGTTLGFTGRVRFQLRT